NKKNEEWDINSDIIRGLPTGLLGGYSAPVVVYNFSGNNKLTQFNGRRYGSFFAYEYNGDIWVQNTSLINGLPDVGDYSYPTLTYNFNNNNKWILISGMYDGKYRGFGWDGQQWIEETDIVNGLGDSSYDSKPTIGFNVTGNDKWTIIVGRSSGGLGSYYGFQWNGSKWIYNTSIVSGLFVPMWYPSPRLVYDYQENKGWTIVTGGDDGYFRFFEWNKDGWRLNESLSNGLTSIGAYQYSAPTIFYNYYQSKWNLISGSKNADIPYNGFSFQFPFTQNNETNITNIPPQEIKPDDSWTFSCRAYDGKDYSEWMDSSSVRIKNSSIIEINSCSELNQSGKYYHLTQDIINSTTSYCMNVKADNIVLDCFGHMIDADAFKASHGISINGRSNITVKNCMISEWNSDGIYLVSSADNIIRNMTFTSNNRAIYIYSSSRDLIEDIDINSHNNYGIWMRYNSNNNIFKNIIFDNNYFNFVQDNVEGESCNNLFINVTDIENKPIVYYNNSNVNIENQDLSEIILCNANNSVIKNTSLNGLLSLYSRNVSLLNLTITNFGWEGIRIDHGKGHILKEIMIRSEADAGLYLGYTENSIISNSIIENSKDGIWLNNANNNLFYNNLINSSTNFIGIANNTLNTDKEIGNNIYGNSNYIGGNYWAKPDGTGYSETCSDSNSDGFCDNPYELTQSNIDNLPLSNNFIECVPNWVINTTWSECNSTNHQYQYYYDGNNCNKELIPPEPINQTCNYCEPGWINIISDCNQNNQINISYTYNNTCCHETGLDSDCIIPENTTIECDYCQENIVGPYYTNWSECNQNCQQTRTRYYLDLNYDSCCSKTNLDSDCHILNNTYQTTEETQACDYCTNWIDGLMINLYDGWNLISLPIELEDKKVQSAFYSIDGMYSDVYTYKNGWHRLEQLSNIDKKDGLWIKSNLNIILIIDGNEIKNLTFNLTKGWNLISYPTTETKNISQLFENVTDEFTRILSYSDNNWLSYIPSRPESLNMLKQMQPGYGYWIYVKNDTTWLFNNTFTKVVE
ncbi:MAG: right-handed parallel beta-helix repeat-containing protein, partial [Nanoarchaeota archaeon]